MKTISATRLAFVLLAFAPSLAGAAPVLDAHVFDMSDHLASHGSDWAVGPDHAASVAFQAINNGALVSIDLRLAARAPAGEKGNPQPVTIELWHGTELLGTDFAGADVPFVWRGDLWNGTFPPQSNYPQGYNEHSFVFPGVTLEAGQTYEWRAKADAYGTDLMTDSGGLGIGNITYSVWVEPSPVVDYPDINGDGRMDLTDFAILKDNFGQAGDQAHGDLTGDGRIDINDFGVLKDNFGRSMAAPEPAGWVLAIAGAMAIWANCRCRQGFPNSRTSNTNFTSS